MSSLTAVRKVECHGGKRLHPGWRHDYFHAFSNRFSLNLTASALGKSSVLSGRFASFLSSQSKMWLRVAQTLNSLSAATITR